MSAPVGVEISPPPPGLEAAYETLFTTDCLNFLYELISTFDEAVDQILQLRVSRKADLDLSGKLPDFLESTRNIRSDSAWRVSPVPARLQRRHVDIGDVAPCDTQHFLKALQSRAQGIQVDFDDGNCPTFHNQIKGIHNVLLAVHGRLPDVPHISQAPVLMIRPRAWNMVEHNMMVESFLEARLWNNVFIWTQSKLLLPQGSIKATVLIENILAAFEMEEILYEMREHSAGLNCGIWDYSASFINKFGHRRDFLLPDRSKYVNMEKDFLRNYMYLLVETCHRRAALATGGMAALLLPDDPNSNSYKTVMATVSRMKLLEIKAGVDGFMVYDLKLIQPMQELFQILTEGDNQLHKPVNHVRVTANDLLTMPLGGVTLYGLKYNIAVGVLFIHAWLSGKGHFYYKGQVEDSATAEISRSQVWQWIRHQASLEDEEKLVSRQLVSELTTEVLMEFWPTCSVRERQKFQTAADLFLEVVQRRDFPEFITSFLNQDHTFLSSQNTQHIKHAKL
ncbi:malate synthase-like isoform X2 [Nerophis ophidion]|uniref:malate synthase-like isoform X2 n=1 Tax=Nerophis ophidion TaxID=159077 RepID=UPI002ADEFF87|nr:malate synthase-like isoform X2 [Nerophis ophidion]